MENLERNCSYRIMFPFHCYLGIRTRQIIPRLCFVSSTRGPEFCTDKLSRVGILTEKISGRGGGGGW